MVHTTEQWQNGGDHRVRVRQPRNQHEHCGHEAAPPRAVCVIQHRDTLRARNAHIFMPQTEKHHTAPPTCRALTTTPYLWIRNMRHAAQWPLCVSVAVVTVRRGPRSLRRPVVTAPMSSTTSWPRRGYWQLVLVTLEPLVLDRCPGTLLHLISGGAVRPWVADASRTGSRGTPIAHP
jgi:hypothetical protein